MKKESFFVRLVGQTLRYPKTTLLIAAAVTVAGVYFGQKIELRSNFSDLLPDDHPAVIQARELDHIVGGASFVVVAVETQDQKAGTAFIDRLRGAILGWKDDIRYIDDRPPEEFLKRSGLLYLSLEDLDRLHERVKTRIEKSKLEKSGLYIDLEEGDADTFDISDLQEKYATFIQNNPYYQDKEGTLFVSLIKPKWRTTDTVRTRALVEKLEEVILDLKDRNAAEAVTVRLTGPYIKTLTQQKILARDAIVVSLLAFLGAIAYLIFHFRRKRAVFLIGMPLTVSVSWSFALAYFFFGSLNLFSAIACAVILGLATDYGIHMYSEYVRQRREGHATPEALQLSVSHLGRAFFVAATTTAGAFFALTLSEFKAMYELGMIAGVGILFCTLAFVILFPPLTLLVEKMRPMKLDRLSATRYQLSALHWVFSTRTLIVVGAILLIPLIAVGFGRLRFDYNLNHILGSQETKKLDQRVDTIFNHSVNPEVALAATIEDAGPLADAIRAVRNRNDKKAIGTTISDVVALPDFVPDQQEKRLEKIAAIKALFTEPVVKSFNEDDRKSYEKFKTLLDPDPISLAVLPDQLKMKFRDREGKVGRIVFVFPNFEMQQADRFMRFVEELREVKCVECSGPFYASGESTVFYEIVKMLFREGRYVMAFALLAVFGMLIVNFRSLRVSFLVFAPLAVGLTATLAWMAVLNIPFNIINLAAVPIILGIATDYVVHLYQRYSDHPEKSLAETFPVSLRPILGSSITTAIGFGSLLAADMGGVRSFGLIALMGILFCTLATLLWFPGLLALMEKRTQMPVGASLATAPAIED